MIVVKATEQRRKADEVVERIRRLPPLPDNIQRINRMIDNEQATINEVAAEIAKDQSISAKVLQLVNSSFYGFSGTVSSISHAVVMLGLNVIRSLVSTSWVSSMMEKSASGFYDHSLATARACFILSRSLGMEEPEELGAIGLLHDIGKVVLAEFLQDDYAVIKSQVAVHNLHFYEAETAHFGITHADLGARLLEKWNLPASTVESIRYHHSTGLAENLTERTALLMLADCMVRAEGIGYSGDHRVPEFEENVAEALDIKVADLEALSNEVYDQIRDIPRHKGVRAA